MDGDNRAEEESCDWEVDMDPVSDIAAVGRRRSEGDKKEKVVVAKYSNREVEDDRGNRE